ncbi:MAG: N(6)-L-threonylcarbamoyladenine synthase Kae1 [Candidatus Aenigmarchaeota archaeon]|jgi:universal protein Kae1|nr:N(6)-L-threonylcarbamoyladenine synthase Kae1 [Candidatus Aenigmarchaeota archaeon]
MRDGNLICLGIEGTAHTFGIGIVSEDGNILADERETYKPPEGKGIVPYEAKKHHENVAAIVLEKALKDAGISTEEIDIISYSAGPGLPPPLLFTANFATKIARQFSKPLVKVHHGIAHIEIGRFLTGCKDPVVVYLSGGHNAILAFVNDSYKIFGETQDITVGNLFDRVARKFGLPMPGGPKIEELAAKGRNYFSLPYTVKGMDVSFTGIQTAVFRLIQKGIRKEDIAFSLQETCFAMLTEVAERALAHTEKNELLLVGGVASNKRLQEMMSKMCEERGAKFYVVPQSYSSDNGVMIAYTGLLAYKKGLANPFEDLVRPRWRIDEVKWFI